MQHRRIISIAVTAGLLSLSASLVVANTAPPALPGGQTNFFSGDYVNGGGGEWNGQSPGWSLPNFSPGPSNLTDGDLDTIANSTNSNNEVETAIFAVPSASQTTNDNSLLGKTGDIELIRVWGQPAFPGDLTNSYVIPPEQVAIKYNYTSNNPNNGNTIHPGSFANQATILSVNGTAPTFLDPGPDTTVNLNGMWQGPVADQTAVGNSPGAYYVDLAVQIPSTNAVYFDFGVQPDRTNGDGGLFVNEIQAIGPSQWQSTSGDWNNAGNWLGIVPNGVDDQAEFNSGTSPQTVFTNQAVTVGSLEFNIGSTYQITGAGSLTLQAATGTATVTVLQGTHELNLPVIIASNSAFNVSSGASLVIANPMTINTGETLTTTGSVVYESTISLGTGAMLNIAGPTTAQTLSLAKSAAEVAVTPHSGDSTDVLQLSHLSIANGNTLNLSNNALIVHGGDLAGITAQLKSGFNGGGWNGTSGITSSTAAADTSDLTALGVIKASKAEVVDGQSLQSGDVLVAYTYLGDADLSGHVDGGDYSLIDTGFNGHLTGWQNGDFNYDGKVDGSDYSLIDNTFNQQGASLAAAGQSLIAGATSEISGGGSAVPEPGSLGLLGIGAAGLIVRRRRSRKAGKLAALAAASVTTALGAAAQSVHAQEIPALPGGATNLFAGQQGMNSAQVGGSYYVGTLATDGALDGGNASGSPGWYLAGGSGMNQSQAVNNVTILAAPAHNYNNTSDTLSTFGSTITTLRVWGQGAYNGYAPGGTVGYFLPPQQVSVFYGWNTAIDNSNAYAINSGSYANQATILAVDGHLPTFNPDGSVSLVGEFAPGRADTSAPSNFGDSSNPLNNYSYAVDLTVSIPDTNGVLFQFGATPADVAGEVVNELQAADIPAPTPTAWAASASGDWNVAGNWTNGIPKGLDAEADFTDASLASQTVYTNYPVAEGTINFNTAGTYLLAGTGSLGMLSSTTAQVIVQQGTGQINLPLTIASNTDFNVASGATLVIGNPMTIDANRSVSLTGTGTVKYLSTITLLNNSSLAIGNSTYAHGLTLGASASVAVAPSTGSPTVLQLDSLTLDPTALLDLNNNDMIVHGGDLATISSAISTAYNFNGALWTGKGITSSAAAADTSALHTLGVVGVTSSTTFDGQAVNSGDVLVKYTYYGDADLSGVVDGNDYTLIDTGYASQGGANPLTGWQNGDFNYDGMIDGSDYSLIDNAFNQQAAEPSSLFATSTSEIAGGSSAVPEPTTLGILGIGALAWMNRRRRR
jgi:PEP-CTERM motif